MVSVRKLVRELSDHNPLLLSSGEESREAPKPREFRFNLSWIKDEKFLPTVSRIWARRVQSSDPIDILNIKLKRFKTYFKGWGSDKYGHNKKRKEELRMELAMLEELEEDGPLSPELYNIKVDVSTELHDILVNEEIYWLQQSHERWLLKGDLNTDYYHKIANGRKRKNTIHSLKAGDAEIEGTNNLIAHATEYYKNPFGPGSGNLFHLDPDTWSVEEKLDASDNADLCREFMEEEIKEALFSMAHNRAPGPDNIPVEFYHVC